MHSGNKVCQRIGVEIHACHAGKYEVCFTSLRVGLGILLPNLGRDPTQSRRITARSLSFCSSTHPRGSCASKSLMRF